MEKIDTILVTGAGSGIGRAIAEKLGAMGLAVGCLSRTERALETANAIRNAGGRAWGLQVDLQSLEETERCVAKWTVECGDQARFAVVLAAGDLGPAGGLCQTDLQAWRAVFQTNVLGNLAALRGVLPRMVRNRFGRVIAFAGGGAAYAYPKFSAYALSKVAMVRAIENLSEELRSSGDIRTVALAPGAVETEMLQRVRTAGAEVRTTVPLHEPVECIARLIANPGWDFSGRFIHVRDQWSEALSDGTVSLPADQWMLRRVEPPRG